jgi:coiled-coil domain-containing protein 6
MFLKKNLCKASVSLIVADKQKMEKLVAEEHKIRVENLRLQRTLQLEVEWHEQLCRQLSESESSLEMDYERYSQPQPTFSVDSDSS